MRWDSLGMFWEDRPIERGQVRTSRPMPEIPVTGWRPKSMSDLPDLRRCRIISFDTETKDPFLALKGPGWGKGPSFGHIVGFSFAAPGVPGFYLPIRHETRPEENLPTENVLAYAKAMLETQNITKTGANLMYDVGWCRQEGIRVSGPLYDVQFAEALLDSEAPRVNLDMLSKKYLGIGKQTDILYQWLSDWTGRGVNHPRLREDIYCAPPSLVGPYAEGDASQPLEILNAQWPKMADRGVLPLFDLECRLIPLLVDMRMKGAPVDLGYTEKFQNELKLGMGSLEREMKDLAGVAINPNASASIQAAFKRNGIPCPINKKTEKISFAADLLELVDHPLAGKILEWKQMAKIKSTFVESYILDSNVNGRIYCSFHPLKGEDSGARSGRFSSSDPNLQNIPARTELGKRVRKAFAAHSGALWRKFDYGQIEYRMLAHFAVGQGADDLRAVFAANPDVDYHEVVQNLIKELVGVDLPRKKVKTINFGLIYGMSKPTLTKRLHLTPAEGNNLFQSYHRAAPFVKATMDAAATEANVYGHITTILGRKSDFHLWAPEEYSQDALGLPYDQAVAKYGIRVKRAYTHKALNRKLQGSAADIMKQAMVTAYEAGLFDESRCGIPLITVHDELDFEDFGDPDAACWKELLEVMENSTPTRVQVRMDGETGPNWGEVE